MAEFPDPLDVGSDAYSVLFENDRVRVLEVNLQPGAKVPMHFHPENVVYTISPGRMRFSFPDGSSQEIEAHAGQVLALPAGPHEPENVGAQAAHVLLIELK